ncbi:flavodoxin family protein [Aquisalinus flavus]|uniref:Flavodoxin n=1 Tax=Aquisalinus flavus TaxID=1526572 RepID=A0A8J2V3M7_9PROT|nr:flavodoxin family protein [Aquisalinus flavus]UNE46843.1 flavodoxin family protein [Aquisalinus flavus]GGC97683.1 flavodoxin [Aquisalinus flavus]
MADDFLTRDTIKALYLNCSLKSSSDQSNTEALMKESMAILGDQGIETELVRIADKKIDAVMDPKHEDEWTGEIYPMVRDANILIIGSPIWLGEMSSLTTKVIERLYAHSAETNDKGQYAYYGQVGAAMVTGNEDGGKHVCRNILYSLQHVGFTIPPQSDVYWVGEAGPGPSYIAAGGNDFTTNMCQTMSWNVIHFARMLKENGGIPAKGNMSE